MGGHLRRAGHISVPLDKPREAIRSMSEAGRVIRENKISVLIFPEGGRTMGEMGEFRDGAAFMAIKAQVPVAPIGLIGVHELLPMHSVHVRPRMVTVSIGDPIPTEGMHTKQRTELTEQFRQQISTLISYT